MAGIHWARGQRRPQCEERRIEWLYEAVAKHKCELDVIFANAGVAQIAPPNRGRREVLRPSFRREREGSLFTVQKGLPFLNEGGAIILTASIATIKGFPWHQRLQRQ